jgi:predicted DNA-binding transcriptional regulator AlpA
MQDNNIIDYDQLLTATEAGETKGMTPNLTAYHLAKPDAPQPVPIGRGKHSFYRASDIEAWEPNRNPNKTRKNTRKGNDQPGK